MNRLSGTAYRFVPVSMSEYTAFVRRLTKEVRYENT